MENGILIINKEKNMTSRDVVNKLVKKFKTKKIGHTGTLDPIAEGVLVVCIGNATKLSELLTSSYKEYIATIKLGIETDTGDITGNIINSKNNSVSKSEVEQVLSSFLGTSVQEVPIYSAVKINGKKLYQYARAKEQVILPKRDINVKKICLLSCDKDEIVFKALVSKGTYIRSLIKDICHKLNVCGTMSSLIRTKQGNFTLEQSYKLEEVEKDNYDLLSIEKALDNLESINIDDKLYSKIKNGAIIEKNFNNDIACFKYNGKIIAIYKTYDKDITKAKPYKMFI